MWCTRQDYLLQGYNWQHAGPKRSRQRSSSSSRPTTIIGWWQGMRGRGRGPKPVCARRSCARMRCGGARLHSAPSPFASTSRMTSSCRCHVETGPLPVLICAYAEAYMSSELGYACAQGYKFFSSRHTCLIYVNQLSYTFTVYGAKLLHPKGAVVGTIGLSLDVCCVGKTNGRGFAHRQALVHWSSCLCCVTSFRSACCPASTAASGSFTPHLQSRCAARQALPCILHSSSVKKTGTP